jgi:predicted glutamine amidotransferase
MVVSEPLDEEDDCHAWREVPAGHLLVIEKHGRLDIAPFIPKV